MMPSVSRILYIVSCALVSSALFGLASGPITKAPPPKTPGQESVRGYLVDMLCVKEEAAHLAELGPRHTKKCLQMPACRQSGYALLLPSTHDVLRLDQRGNELAAKLLDSHRLESGWLVQVRGKRSDDQFAVIALELTLAPRAAKKKR